MEIITLRCLDCENTRCKLARKYMPYETLEGCTRKVLDDDCAKYCHLIDEVAPFMYKNTTKEYQSRTYKEIIEFLEHIYSCPIGQKLGKSGQIKLI